MLRACTRRCRTKRSSVVPRRAAAWQLDLPQVLNRTRPHELEAVAAADRERTAGGEALGHGGDGPGDDGHCGQQAAGGRFGWRGGRAPPATSGVRTGGSRVGLKDPQAQLVAYAPLARLPLLAAAQPRNSAARRPRQSTISTNVASGQPEGSLLDGPVAKEYVEKCVAQ